MIAMDDIPALRNFFLYERLVPNYTQNRKAAFRQFNRIIQEILLYAAVVLVQHDQSDSHLF